MRPRAVYIESLGYVCGHGSEDSGGIAKLLLQPDTDDACINTEALRDAGVERRLRSQVSEHGLLAVLAAKRCVARAQITEADRSELALFLGVPSGGEVGLPFLEAVRSGLVEHPLLTRRDVFEARGVNVLELLRLSTGNTAGHIARQLALHGPNACYIGGKASFFALSRAVRAIATGGLSRALVVGGESVCQRKGTKLGARAGCAVLLSADPGTARPELGIPLRDSTSPFAAAAFECFESLDSLLNLSLVLESQSDRDKVRIDERSVSGDHHVLEIRRWRRAPLPADAAITQAEVPRSKAHSHPRRVVITAIGLVTPLGNDMHTFSERLFAGHSAGRRLSDAFGPDWAGLPVAIGAPVPPFTNRAFPGVPVAELERSGRFALEAVAQIVDSVGEGLLRELRAPLYCGVGAAQPLLDFDEARRLCDGTDLRPRQTASACERSSQILREAFLLTGPAKTFAGACSASTQACIQAAEEIRAGLAVAVIAGGHDSLLSVPGLYMMHELGTLSTSNTDPTRAVRPFDMNRDGTMVGEGAVYFLFEEREHARARGATILAEVTGWGSSLDGHHMTSPDPDGTHAAAMIRAALSLASLGPEAVDYVNAHGTATLLNDATEARSLQTALAGNRPWVSSSKPQVGHLIGACGAVELAVCIAALVHQRLPPNLNLESRDPDCDLRLVLESRPATIDVALSNSFGFGGQNSCLILRRAT